MRRISYIFVFIVQLMLITHCSVSLAQQAIIFDSLFYPRISLTDDAIYIQSDKFVKADYSGNILWAKDFKAACLSLSGDRIYVGFADSLIALDSTGQTLWSLEFSDTLQCITDSATIWTICASMDRIYLGIRDGYQPTPAIVTLDTSGNVINTLCGNVNLYSYLPQESVIASDGGCWMSFYKFEFTRLYRTIKIGRNGQIEPVESHEISGGNLLPRPLLQTHDSSHIVLGSYNNSIIDIIFLLKESDYGQLRMYWQYWGPMGSFTSGPYAEGIDQNGNIYILCYTDKFGIMKIDSTGHILQARSWNPALQPGFQISYTFGDIHCKNDSIYIACQIDGKTAVIKLDTNLNAACYAPNDTLLMSLLPLSLSSITNFSEASLNYTPTLISATLPTANFAPATQSCILPGIEETTVSTIIQPYPNPTSDIIRIKGIDCNAFSLYDLNGKEQKLNCETEDGIQIIDLQNLSAGIYFIQNKDNHRVSKIIKMAID